MNVRGKCRLNQSKHFEKINLRFTLRCSQTNSHGNRAVGRRWKTRTVARPFKQHIWLTTRRTSPCVTPVCRFQKQLQHWRHSADCATHPSINASLGVTVSLRDASLTGNLAINSTRLASCAVWGPLVSGKCRRCNRKKDALVWNVADVIHFCFVNCWVEGKYTMWREGKQYLWCIYLWCTAASCGGRRRIAGEDWRLEWTLEKELKSKGKKQRQNKKRMCVLVHTLPDNEFTAFEYSRFTNDGFAF